MRRTNTYIVEIHHVFLFGILVFLCHEPFVAAFVTRRQQQYEVRTELYEADEVGEARNLLFQDQHRAMSDRAEIEKQLLEPNMVEMVMKDTKQRKQKRSGSGGGFGTSNNVSGNPRKSRKAPLSEDMKLICKSIRTNGVALVPNVLKKDTAEALRNTVLEEIECMRDATRKNPLLSPDYFYVPAEIHFSSPRGYVLLPLRDSASVAAGPNDIGTLVTATRELLQPNSALGTLFEEMCCASASNEPELYDYCVLRTEQGAARQLVHSDTPFQEIPGLFCAFIALQDVTFDMGGTMFLPGTHVKSTERNQFDDGVQRDEMLAACQPEYVLLKQGDAALFDMRVLHAGLANKAGPTRLIMAITFRNPKAIESLGHRPNLRPAYASRFSLSSFQQELGSDAPFACAGNGLTGKE